MKNRNFYVYMLGATLLLISTLFIPKEDQMHNKMFGVGSGICIATLLINFKLKD